MTINKAKKMVEAKLKCMERDVSGKDDCNSHRCYECSLNYEQGNMGEQKEWLRMSIRALELQESGDKILDEILNKMAIVRKEIDDYGFDDDAVRVYDAIVEIIEMFKK